jgi:hypothetical protein
LRARQYALLSGLWRYFFSKPQVQLLVVGLDFAGKTVSAAARRRRERRLTGRAPQTLMESVKRQFSSGTTTPLPKVPPTVGLNGALLAASRLWGFGRDSRAASPAQLSRMRARARGRSGPLRDARGARGALGLGWASLAPRHLGQVL